MLRHTRPLLELYKERGALNQNLAKREVLAIPQIKFTDEEQEAYRQLNAYCEELSQQIARHDDERSTYNVGFYKSFVRLRFASSFNAITQTVRRRVERVQATLDHLRVVEQGFKEPDLLDLEALVTETEDEDATQAEEALLKNRSTEDLRWELSRLDDLLKALERLHGPSSKMSELLSTLDRRKIEETGRLEQTVIFTRFYDTLTAIIDRLRLVSPNLLIGTYSGRGGQFTDPGTKALVWADRELVKHKFLQGEFDVLICTDAAAEGLNLQTANLIINYDLPWNPMKVEQRIGRLDRIGQKHDWVYVLNLCYADSSEQIVYGRLLRRLRDAGMIVGTQQISLLPVTSDEFRQLAEGELSEHELEARALERAEAQRARTQSMEIPPEDLFEIYQRLEQADGAMKAPVDLDAIWSCLSTSDYLRDLGCKVNSDEVDKVMTVLGVEGASEKSVITSSRLIYEEGIPGEVRPIHFASYGDPVFDALIDHMEQFDLPASIQRIGLRIADLPFEVVGYAVAIESENSVLGTQLITSWKQLDGLSMAEGETLAEEQLVDLRAKLREMARAEFQPTLAAKRIEKSNLRRGRAQLAFALMLGHRLTAMQMEASPQRKGFFALMAELESRLGQNDEFSIRDLDAEQLRSLEDHLLFDAGVPALGSHASIQPPEHLLQSAINAAYREADAIRRRRSELDAEAVVSRLERRIDEEMEEFARA